jgi:hypothetical protein
VRLTTESNARLPAAGGIREQNKMIQLSDQEARLVISALKDAAEFNEIEAASNRMHDRKKQPPEVLRRRKKAEAYAGLLKELRSRRIKA